MRLGNSWAGLVGESFNRHSEGALDDVRIYNRAVAADEAAGLAAKYLTVYVNKLYEKDLSTGTATSSYYLGKTLIATKEGSTLRYAHSDSLGSGSVATDASGTVVGSQTLKPFGETWAGEFNSKRMEDQVFRPLRHTGKMNAGYPYGLRHRLSVRGVPGTGGWNGICTCYCGPAPNGRRALYSWTSHSCGNHRGNDCSRGCGRGYPWLLP